MTWTDEEYRCIERNQRRTDELLEEAARGEFGERVCGVTVALATAGLLLTASHVFNQPSATHPDVNNLGTEINP